MAEHAREDVDLPTPSVLHTLECTNIRVDVDDVEVRSSPGGPASTRGHGIIEVS